MAHRNRWFTCLPIKTVDFPWLCQITRWCLKQCFRVPGFEKQVCQAAFHFTPHPALEEALAMDRQGAIRLFPPQLVRSIGIPRFCSERASQNIGLLLECWCLADATITWAERYRVRALYSFMMTPTAWTTGAPRPPNLLIFLLRDLSLFNVFHFFDWQTHLDHQHCWFELEAHLHVRRAAILTSALAQLWIRI